MSPTGTTGIPGLLPVALAPVVLQGGTFGLFAFILFLLGLFVVLKLVQDSMNSGDTTTPRELRGPYGTGKQPHDDGYQPATDRYECEHCGTVLKDFTDLDGTNPYRCGECRHVLNNQTRAADTDIWGW